MSQYDVVHTNYDKTSISDQWLSALGGEIEENLNVRLETYTDLLQKKKADSIMVSYVLTFIFTKIATLMCYQNNHAIHVVGNQTAVYNIHGPYGKS